MNVLGVILARGGSSRLLNKNLLPLGGISMTARAARDACLARRLTTICISTDNEEIAREAITYGVQWVKRPPELCTGTAKIEDALRHALEFCEAQQNTRFDFVVGLQAAVPVRPIYAIDEMILEVERLKTRGGVTVIPSSPWVWWIPKDKPTPDAATWWNPADYPRSQDINLDFYSEINSIQIAPRDEVMAGKRWGSPLLLFVLPKWADVDIDTMDDYRDAVTKWPGIEKHLQDWAEFKSVVVSVPAMRQTADKKFKYCESCGGMRRFRYAVGEHVYKCQVCEFVEKGGVHA